MPKFFRLSPFYLTLCLCWPRNSAGAVMCIAKQEKHRKTWHGFDDPGPLCRRTLEGATASRPRESLKLGDFLVVTKAPYTDCVLVTLKCTVCCEWDFRCVENVALMGPLCRRTLEGTTASRPRASPELGDFLVVTNAPYTDCVLVTLKCTVCCEWDFRCVENVALMGPLCRRTLEGTTASRPRASPELGDFLVVTNAPYTDCVLVTLKCTVCCERDDTVSILV
ncbi:hypothetical protein BX666DRAFT_1882249 [Dichotomocladium elegans]|nr:hypothetical protein BX666DRAFT_1882249 [Dichotomocladium elegans]